MNAYIHIEAIMRDDEDEYRGASDRWALPSSIFPTLDHMVSVVNEDEDEYGLGIPVRVVTVSGEIDAATLAALRSEWSLDPEDSEPNMGFLGDLGDGMPRIYESERYNFDAMDFNVGGWSPVLDVTVSVIAS